MIASIRVTRILATFLHKNHFFYIVKILENAICKENKLLE